jgi:anti-anti-sigma factor
MTLDVEQLDSIVVVRPRGDLDDDAVKTFQEQLPELLSKDDPRVVVDLRKATRITSAALRLFVTLSKQLDSRGGGFVLCAPEGDVKRAIVVGGLDRLCRVLPTLRQALESLQVDDRMERLARAVCELLGRAETRLADALAESQSS